MIARFFRWLRIRWFFCADCQRPLRRVHGVPVRIPGTALLFCSPWCADIAAGRLGLVQPIRKAVARG